MAPLGDYRHLYLGLFALCNDGERGKRGIATDAGCILSHAGSGVVGGHDEYRRDGSCYPHGGLAGNSIWRTTVDPFQCVGFRAFLPGLWSGAVAG